MTDLDLTQSTTPTVTLNRALIIFLASVLAMIPGWLLAAYIPLWFAPPKEMLGWTFLMYILPVLLWIRVPILLVKRWKIKTSNKSRFLFWIPLYLFFFALWIYVFGRVFGAVYDHGLMYRVFVIEQDDCSLDNKNNGVIIYNCGNHITLKGREGLPFVWYTGEIISTPEAEND